MLSCCLLLLVLLSVAQADMIETQSNGNEMSRAPSLTYNGHRLRCYQQGSLRIVQPYIALQAQRSSRVRRDPLGDGAYFTVPLAITDDIKLPSTPHRQWRLMSVNRFKVQLREAPCRTKCPKVRVAAEWHKTTPLVRFRCSSRRACQGLRRSLRFKSERSSRLRASLKFTFFGSVNDSHYSMSRVGLPVAGALSRPFAKEFWFESDKLVLFTIKSNIGVSAFDAFHAESNYAIPRDGSLPPVFRSHLLDKLSTVASAAKWQIVAEMRKDGRAVSQVVFNGDPTGLTKDTWFSAQRLVSSKPYWIGHTSYNFFSIAGDAGSKRHFFINRNYGGCGADRGFWVVSDHRDVCPWGYGGFKGKVPSLLYAPYEDVPYQSGNLQTADNFLIYMRLARPAVRASPSLRGAYEFEKNKILLFTVSANSNNVASDIFLNSARKDSTPTGTSMPDIFRSELIDQLSSAFKTTGMHHIVAEMRAGSRMVAQVVFDISVRRSVLDKENWFSADRVVSSYPYPVGNSFNYFSIRGHMGPNWKRSFFISFNYGGCPADRAFWVVSERQDPCTWANRHWTGRSPALIYTGSRAPTLEAGGAKYDANRFLVYLA